MAKVIIIHVVGEDPLSLGDGGLPQADRPVPGVHQPRKRDGKPIAYVTTGAKSFMFPWHRLSFVERL